MALHTGAFAKQRGMPVFVGTFLLNFKTNTGGVRGGAGAPPRVAGGLGGASDGSVESLVFLILVFCNPLIFLLFQN